MVGLPSRRRECTKGPATRKPAILFLDCLHQNSSMHIFIRHRALVSEHLHEQRIMPSRIVPGCAWSTMAWPEAPYSKTVFGNPFSGSGCLGARGFRFGSGSFLFRAMRMRSRWRRGKEVGIVGPSRISFLHCFVLV